LLLTTSTLDDPAARAIDRSGMLGLVAALPAHLRAGFAAGREMSGLPPANEVTAMVVCGMGGSGVAGDVVRSVYSGSLPVPVSITKGYALPASFGRGTLVLAVSYSGDTEETLAAYDEAVARGCSVASVSAGGGLAERAARHGRPHAALPGEVQMPRTAVGYLAGAALGVVEATGLAPPIAADVERAVVGLEDLAVRLGPDRAAGDNESKTLALWLAGRTPVVWGAEGVTEAAALRWRNQLNENAKIPAFSSVLPELDHNEIEGWGPGMGAAFGLVVLRHSGEDARVAARVDGTLEAVAASGLGIRQVRAEGSSAVEELFSLILKGDFASVYLALLRGVDPTPIPVLTGLKERLRR
jgi:glucose/mannose-6-phosphate isomerase